MYSHVNSGERRIRLDSDLEAQRDGKKEAITPSCIDTDGVASLTKGRDRLTLRLRLSGLSGLQNVVVEVYI